MLANLSGLSRIAASGEAMRAASREVIIECARLTGASAAGESPAGRRRQATTSTPSHGPSFARMEVKR